MSVQTRTNLKALSKIQQYQGIVDRLIIPFVFAGMISTYLQPTIYLILVVGIPKIYC